jgi:transcription elongation factor Elf1
VSAPAAPRHGGGEAPTPRAQPFYCPYCGEEEVRPAGEGAGEFHCSACERRFDLRFLGVGR